MSQTAIEEARFLLDRLSEVDFSLDSNEFIRDWCGHVEPAMARLTAALHAKAEVSVEVKELVWCNNNGRELAGDWPMRYEIYNCPWGYVVEMNSMKVPHGTEAHKTLKAAKSAAQQDYEQRILSALSTKLQEPVGEISVLPCDVTVGSTLIRKGVNFGIFVRALQRHATPTHLEQRVGK